MTKESFARIFVKFGESDPVKLKSYITKDSNQSNNSEKILNFSTKTKQSVSDILKTFK